MKKLMTIAAVALCTAAIADSGNSITSSSIVGYKAEQLREGFTMMTTTFVNVSDADAGIDLCDLIPDGSYTANAISVQTLNYDGTTDKYYSFTKDRSGNWFWKDIDTSAKITSGDVSFKAGEGLWISGVDNTKLTNAGAVSTDDNVIALREGFIASGNMTPVAIDLTAIVPNGTYTANAISVQTLNYDGTTDKYYSFTKDRSGNWFWKDIDTGSKIAEGDVVFAPGQGLWISGVDGATLTFPGPTL